jgi:alpha-N-arabinofuranosidase
VVFRSDKVTGPYVPLATNPILTQRDLPNDRPNPITSTGHAKFVDTPSGEWWTVFLGVRPYDAAGDFNTGRETFMMPVRWQGGWPRITDPGQPVPWKGRAPKLPPRPKGPVPLNGDFKFREGFDRPTLAPYWMMLRNPDGHWWRIRKGALEIDPRPVALGEHGNPSLFARRQQHLNATATTEVRFRAGNDNAEAGLIAFQNDEYWYFLGVGSEHGKPVVRLRTRTGGGDAAGKIIGEAPLPVAPGSPVQLRISAHGPRYDFAWSADGRNWRTLEKGADGTVLSTKKAGGFVGAVVGLYAHDGSGGGK